jgi:hypothetical protein
MHSFLTKLIAGTVLIFFVSSCSYEIEQLSSENAEYLLTEYDTLVYLYNQTDTCKVNVDTYFSEGSVHYMYGLGNVTDDYGTSTFYLPDSVYMVSLSVYGIKDALNLGISLKDQQSIYYGRSDKIFAHQIKKTDLTFATTLFNTEYTSCYSYDAAVSLYSNDAGIQRFIYNKNLGLIQLIMKDSTRFELIGAK